MNILMLAINDPAGTAIRFARALGRHTPHSCRVVTLETRYTHGWETDLHVPNLDAAGMDELGMLFEHADILHFHMTADEDTTFGPYLPRDFLAGKTIVHHHHGHPDFRGTPQKYRQKYAERDRRNLLVSTPDLLHFLPEARFQPNLVPQSDPAYLPLPFAERGDPRKLFRVGHSPTRKELKNTGDLLAANERIGPPLDLDIMDDIPHAQCLARKRRCHAVFDHMQGYYGMASLESLSQGVATIAGLADHTMDTIRETFGCDTIPWLLARNAEELEALLRELLHEPERAAAAGMTARQFMEDVWSERAVAQILGRFYDAIAA
ncbi:glycosyltransferase family 1 protein [Oceanidesulfovibrio indonesiensis]|uniref:Glycosyltransferase family 1 protein n=1 Tax=Oceanidesulfovibrio indonesiensis TaxID=54767 RepID=A0A7M3MAB5_9BACT|nr:glycosyltransferase family 1 protein [Oceanidesulfovibrio indonesiensis]TVM14553.1 glycosyltransferase family 1 protein [Oceanidesulfovibrio indonesiensis]